MKNAAFLLAAIAALLFPCATPFAQSLEEGFRNPPDSAKPHTWYHMMNGNVTKEGITCDFEALAAAGIGGVQMFDAGCDIPPGPLAFNSPEWFDMFRHAASEARRLGLEICIPNCSGWSSSGGPWNMPSNGMKKVVFTETPVHGPAPFHGTLPRTENDHGFYEDIAVLAFPAPPADAADVDTEEARPDAKRRLSNIDAKTFGIRDSVTRDTTEAAPDQVVRRERIVDLTARMAPDGSLAWDVPEGDWILLRVGHICNGRRNHPASQHGAGLEVDKLSASAMDYHFDQYVKRLCDCLGPLAGDVPSGFNNILVDSYEVGSQNWTQGLEKTFEARMGYSPLPYLPVFTGRVVGSVDESERFLEDFRRLVADLFAENYAGRLAELCHRHGLMLSLEPYGNAPCDNLQYGQDADIPMGEFWSNVKYGDHTTGSGNARLAASLAHVWGRRYAATESFTANPASGGRWLTTPFSIKAQGDGVFCDGVNRIIYHRFVHQPWPGNQYLPGMTMGKWGMHLDRTQTWWPYAGPWFRYQARCQWMLQEGAFVADVLYFCGEQVPNPGSRTGGAAGRAAEELDLPPGYDWDVCSTKALEALTVADGCVVAPGGVAYRLLVLPPQETMSERLLRKVDALVDAGAKVCGMEKPVRAPGLRGYPAADGRVRALADTVWAKGVFTCRPAEALARLGVAPDFVSAQRDPAPRWIHRRGADADWYFVALNNQRTHTFEASFRQTGRAPEIWDAETGAIRPAEVWREEGGRTHVALSFPPSGSAFVVFRKPATGDHAVDVSVKASPRPDPVEPGVAHTLEISKALYGVFARPDRPDCADVSPILKPGRMVSVTNDSLGGDPAPQKYKELEVVYTLDGRERRDVAKEYSSYTLPPGAELKSAWYGLIDPAWKPAEDVAVDITEKVAAAVKGGTVSVKIDNALAGRDPMYHTPKAARIAYVYDGRASTVEVAEHSVFQVPADSAAIDAPPAWEWRGGRIFAWQPLAAEVKSASGAVARLAADPPAPVLVEGSWDVSFPEGWDAPPSASFPRLVSWTERPEDGIKYFSGTATYTKSVPAPALPPDARLVLDLGAVKNFAEVSVNGEAYPVLWKPPYRVDVTDALDGGRTSLDLSIRVTNLWPNRLIGDDVLYADDCEWKGGKRDGVNLIAIKEIPQWVKDGQRSPTGRHTFTTWKHWDKDDEPLPSGLLGPVLLRTLVPARPSANL